MAAHHMNVELVLLNSGGMDSIPIKMVISYHKTWSPETVCSFSSVGSSLL